MNAPHPLDNPIWNSLRTEQINLASGEELARRFPPEIGPLSGIPRFEPENLEALRLLAGPGGIVVLFLEEAHQAPQGWSIFREGPLVQMVQNEIRPAVTIPQEIAPHLRPLKAADASAMLELATLTEPGPFRSRTHELGSFWGIFEGERLLAMAGQRLHLPEYVEVSAVCTHPDARGRGYAQLLISIVCDEIRGRDKTPFLHAWADNYSAIRVYERLGFSLRRNLYAVALKNER
jgi:ribosomal protein S18 acetylase RimI-like enzyme